MEGGAGVGVFSAFLRQLKGKALVFALCLVGLYASSFCENIQYCKRMRVNMALRG